MSIVTLKRKSKALHSTGINFNTVSKSGVGFSLNGISRPVGAVGPTNLGRSVTRTPFRGTVPIGWGGGSRCRIPNSNRARATKCGVGHVKPNGDIDEYPLIVSNSGSCCIPQYLMKRSVKNTKGMLYSRYTGILFGAYPRTWVQDIANPLNSSSGQYTAALAQQPFSRACTGEAPTWTGSSFNATGAGSKEALGSCGRNPDDPPDSQCNAIRMPYAKNLNLHARDYPDYLRKVKAQCLNPLCTQKPFPYKVTNGSCTNVFTTWQQARAAGQLCKEHSGGGDFPTFKATNETIYTAVNLWATDNEKAWGLYGDISKWDVSGVTNMDYLFMTRPFCMSHVGDVDCDSLPLWTTPFNDDISGWDVSNCTSFRYMFAGASAFNQNLIWNVSNGTDFTSMFNEATSFNQSLCWKVQTSPDAQIANMFLGSNGCVSRACCGTGIFPGFCAPVGIRC